MDQGMERQYSAVFCALSEDYIIRERTNEDHQIERVHRDGESGEIAISKMCVLRNRPEAFPTKFPCIPHCSGHCYIWPCPLLREQNYSRRLRIQENMAKISVLFHQQNQFLHPRQSVRHADVEPFLFTYLGGCNERPLFRIPLESYQTGTEREEVRSLPKRGQIINIWEEFLHGTSALDQSYRNNTRERDKSLAATLQIYLSQFLSQSLVNVAVYLAHFIIYFFSMCFYNMFWSFLGYILLDGHIRIHERAYEYNVNVKFGGSVFQGPAYILVRDWCEHCQQRVQEKMSIRLMKKMKKDIIFHGEKPHIVL